MVEDNPERQRFELRVGEDVAVAVYRREPGLITFLHTEVPDALRGQGLGTELARGALELVRQSGEQVVSRCSFITDFVAKHAEFQDLVRGPGR